MKRLAVLAIGTLIGLVSLGRTENLLTFSSNTNIVTSSPTFRMIHNSTLTRVDRLDAIHVNTPGGAGAKLEIWDADEASTTAKRKIGTYDTTAKFEWIFPYGLNISSNVIFNNTGSPPADITLAGRKNPGGFP